jgi:FkbM family methyltransferase
MFALQLSNLAKELYFCCTAPAGLRSSLTLLFQTLRFHAANKFPMLKEGNVFSVWLHLGSNYRAHLHLRPFSGDLFILYEVLVGRCYEIPPQHRRPNDVKLIVDCGANIGITSLYFASRYPNATILSIEPHPENFALLKKNAAAEPRILPIHAAVVGKPQDHVRLTLKEKAWGNRLTSEPTGFKVQALTIGEVVEGFGGEKVDILKVDIEGAEAEVFGHADFLSKVEFGLIELHDGYDAEKFRNDLIAHGHRLLQHSAEDGIKMLGFEKVGRHR